jgi:uroporphyrinogen decarboxylase
MQIAAGVDAVQIFDSWAGVLAYDQFCDYSLKYAKKIIERIKPKVPVILFCRGASVFAGAMAGAAPSGVSIDWNARLADIRTVVPKNIALQGNLDPDILYAPHHKIREETTALLHSMKGDPGYIFNLGHGITPEVSVDAVRVLVDTVKNYKCV